MEDSQSGKKVVISASMGWRWDDKIARERSREDETGRGFPFHTVILVATETVPVFWQPENAPIPSRGLWGERNFRPVPSRFPVTSVEMNQAAPHNKTPTKMWCHRVSHFFIFQSNYPFLWNRLWVAEETWWCVVECEIHVENDQCTCTGGRGAKHFSLDPYVPPPLETRT